MDNLIAGIDIRPDEMANAYIQQVRGWRDQEPRLDLIDLFRRARRVTLRLLQPEEFWCLVWDYWPGHEPHELMTSRGTLRLLRDVAAQYLQEVVHGYSRPGFTDRVEAMRCLFTSGQNPDPVFLLAAPAIVPPGGSFRIADGVGRMTALAAVAIESAAEPRPAAMIAEI